MKKKRKKKTWELHYHRKKWTEKEEDLLRELYPDVFTNELQGRLDRTEPAIRAKARKLGLKKRWRKYDPSLEYDRRPWSEREIECLKKLYPLMPDNKLAAHFPKRSKSAIGKRANALGLKKDYLHHFVQPDDYDAQLWREQKDLLIKLYPTTDNKELAKMFNRSVAAISNQAWKMGLHKAGYKPAPRPGGNAKLWSEKEDELIRQLYPSAWTKDLAARLGRTEKAVMARAILLGVRKDPEKFTPPPRPETWSDEDIRTLRQLWDEGHTKVEIARMLGKTTASVAGQIQRQARDHGLQTKWERTLWSKTDDEYLIKYNQSKSARELGAILRRTLSSIHNRVRFLGLRTEAPQSWTNKEVATLKKFFKTLPYEEIAARLGRTAAAVQEEALKLGLRKRKP